MTLHHRTIKIERSVIDTSARTIEFSASSESNEVKTYIEGHGYVREILVHTKNSIDLNRFDKDRGGPLLYNHNTDELIGRYHITDLKGGKLSGKARFGNSESARTRWQDAQDGILTDASISYSYDPADIEVTERDTSGRALAVRVNRWTLYEVSLVTVPADPGVGIGRSLRTDGQSEQEEEPEDKGKKNDQESDPEEPEDPENSKKKGKKDDQADEEESEDRTDDPEDEEDTAKSKKSDPKRGISTTGEAEAISLGRKESRMDRIAAILALADKFSVAPEKRNEWISQNATVEHVKSEILEGFRVNARPLDPMTEQLGMNASERKNYSIAKAIRYLITKDPSEAGLEREVSQAMAKRLGRASDGLLIPSDMRVRGLNTQNTAVAAQGGALVFPEYQGYLELLKNATVVLQMGARLVTGLQGTPTWVRQTGASQVYWINENPDNDVTDSKITFDLVTSTPKTAKSLLTYTRQQVLQSIESFEPLVQQDLLEQDALAVDTAALNGSGSSYQPLGLLNQAGIHSMNLGANGRKPTYADLTKMRMTVKKANALGLGTGGYLTTPEIQDLLENTPKLSNTIATPVWENDKAAGYQAIGANQVPSNLTKGTSTNCHALIFGIWSELFILEWGALEMIVDPYTKSAQDIVRVTTSHLLDVFVRRPQAFVAAKDALAE